MYIFITNISYKGQAAAVGLARLPVACEKMYVSSLFRTKTTVIHVCDTRDM